MRTGFGRLLLTLIALVGAGAGLLAQEDFEGLDAQAILKDDQRFHCRIVGIGDGVFQFEADWMRGRGQALLESVRSLVLSPRAAEAGSDRLSLTNGDVLVGTITSMDATTIALKSDIMGDVTLPRSLVTNIVHTDAGGVLLHTDFVLGSMQPWKTVEGTWEVKDGLMRSVEGSAVASAKADQDGSITVSTRFSGRYGVGDGSIMLFMGRPRSIGDAKLVVTVSSYRITVLSRLGGGHDYLIQKRLGDGFRHNPANELDVHVAVDAEKKEVTVWLNGEKFAEAGLPEVNPVGKYIAVQTEEGMGLATFRLSKGADSPVEDVETQAQPDSDQLLLKNGDRFSATETHIRDGQVIAVLQQGELKFTAERITAISLRTDGRTMPRRNAGDAHIYTPRSKLTLRPLAMDGKKLVGKSEYLGEVRIDAKAIRRIDFDIYRALLDELSDAGTTPSSTWSTEDREFLIPLDRANLPDLEAFDSIDAE